MKQIPKLGVSTMWQNQWYMFIGLFKIQGSAPESAVNLGGYQRHIIEATLMSNMAIKRQFYGVFGDIFENWKKLSYEAEFAFFWQVSESAVPIWNLTSYFEAIWGQYGLKPLILVNFYSNIVLKWHFFIFALLEAISPKTWFHLKSTFQPLASIEVWG